MYYATSNPDFPVLQKKDIVAKVYHMTTTVEPANFVGLAISRDRTRKSLIITQSNYVATLIDIFSIPTSSAKYPMLEDYLRGTSFHSEDPLLTPICQTLFQEKVGSILCLASQIRPDLFVFHYSTISPQQ